MHVLFKDCTQNIQDGLQEMKTSCSFGQCQKRIWAEKENALKTGISKTKVGQNWCAENEIWSVSSSEAGPTCICCQAGKAAQPTVTHKG